MSRAEDTEGAVGDLSRGSGPCSSAAYLLHEYSFDVLSGATGALVAALKTSLIMIYYIISI